MSVKKTTDSIVTAFRAVNNAKIGKMEDSEKFAFIKAVRQLKKVASEFDENLKDAQERLKPEGFNAMASKVQSNESLTAEESAALAKYNCDIDACLKEELEKEVELTFEPLSEDAIGRFIASNDFAVKEIMVITDVIGE